MERQVKETGYNLHRHENNPKEKELHDCFIESVSKEDMNYLVFGQKRVNKDWEFLTARERKIVISTIQWVGSPQGQGLLRECGFAEKATYEKREKLFSGKIACLEKQLKRIPRWIKLIFK